MKQLSCIFGCAACACVGVYNNATATLVMQPAGLLVLLLLLAWVWMHRIGVSCYQQLHVL